MDSMDMSHDAQDEGMWVYYCNGEKFHDWHGGSWIGHFAFGIGFSIWATHWLIASTRNYVRSRQRGDPYRARATYPLLASSTSDNALYAEIILKFLLPVVGINMELWLDHPDHVFRTMYCPEGTELAGHFVGGHVNNWQHTTMYLGFMLSGLVDIISIKTDILPSGTPHVVLSMAFGVEALLMGLHTKHEPLDSIMHVLLYGTMAATTVAVLLEAVVPTNMLLSLCKSAAVYLQAFWFFMVARVMFEFRTEWKELPGDMAPTMIVPVFFALSILAALVVTLAIFIGATLYFRWADKRTAYDKLEDSGCGASSGSGSNCASDSQPTSSGHSSSGDEEDGRGLLRAHITMVNMKK